MNTKSLLKNWGRVWISLSATMVIGAGLVVAGSSERPATSVAPRQIVDGGQETHGGGGGKGGRRSELRLADGNGQETHGGKGGRRSDFRVADGNGQETHGKGGRRSVC